MRWRLNDRLWVPADGVIPATAWWDTTLPGGMIPGADPGVRLIPDWSGKERHGLQVLAANQGSISALGPNGDLSVTLDGADDGWRVQGALAYATTFVGNCGKGLRVVLDEGETTANEFATTIVVW